MRVTFVILLAATALLPLAAAHTSVFTDDGRYRVVVGQLNEPVVTYAKTGLDVCFQANTTARTPLAAINAGDFSGTLISPGGERLTQDLRSQFGRPGCFQFQTPYVLTEPGQYLADLTGVANGTAFDFRGVVAGGPVEDVSAISFPERVPTNLELAAEKADREELETLRTRLQVLESQLDSRETTKASPWTGLTLVVIALAALALSRRSKTD